MCLVAAQMASSVCISLPTVGVPALLVAVRIGSRFLLLCQGPKRHTDRTAACFRRLDDLERHSTARARSARPHARQVQRLPRVRDVLAADDAVQYVNVQLQCGV